MLIKESTTMSAPALDFLPRSVTTPGGLFHLSSYLLFKIPTSDYTNDRKVSSQLYRLMGN